MPNPFFQFKQFIIQQDKCAMKVCTDACLFGAWVADELKDVIVQNILDIGSGTGLLSLMLAQKINAQIEAIEINNAAALQSAENILASPWHQNIKLINRSVQDFIPEKKYDLIISNPPFYEDDLRSPDENKNAAKHDTTFRLEELISISGKYLTDQGTLALLLPFHRADYLEKITKDHKLFIQKKLLVKHSTKHHYFRAMFLLSKNETGDNILNELIIHDNERNYTAAFEYLLKDYYLKL